MRICPRCGANLPDDAQFCTNCGTPFNSRVPQQQYYVNAMPWDHTAQFDPRDISENKVICMLLYLSSLFGILIALLSQNNSPYVAFHLRQALKFLVVETLLAMIAAILFFTILIPVAAGICVVILQIIKIICFFQICGNKAIEPAIIRSLGFLR